MSLHIPRVTIYRIGKFEPEKNTGYIDLLLQFRNPNQSIATVTFQSLTKEQLEEQTDKIIVQTTMPSGEIIIDPPEIYQDNQSVAQSIAVADSATTNVKAKVARLQEDQKYVYKASDNFVVLILKMHLPEKFSPEKQDLYFGFQMTTQSLRFKQEDDAVNMTTPVLINCGKATVKSNDEERKAKEAQLRASQQSAASQ